MRVAPSRAILIAASLLLLGGCAGVPDETVSSSTVLAGGATADNEQTAIGRHNVSNKRSNAVSQRATPSISHTTEGRRVLPERDSPEVVLSSSPEPDDLIPGDVVRSDDLWQRLRSGFRLSNLETDPQRVAHFEKWYAKHPKYFTRLAERAYWFLPYVLEQVEARGLPGEVAILPAIESAFRPDATSRSRAAGMWQFIGSTGRRFGLRQDWWMDGRRDLVQSTRAALDYLEYLAGEFDGDWELALASYNAGEGTIGKAVKKNRKSGKPINYAHLELRRETAEYIPRLFAVRNILKQPEKFGITLPPLANVQTVKVIDLKTQTDISVAASFVSLTHKQLHFLNLGYKRGVTPPNGPHVLVVPAAEADALVAELGNLNPTQRMQWAHHKVRKGEVLGQIARTHRVTVRSIQRANSLKDNTIHIGQELRIPLSTGPVQYAGPALKSNDGVPKTHLVAKGESLWKIATSYGLKLSTLLRINDISRRTTLYPGQSLIISR